MQKASREIALGLAILALAINTGILLGTALREADKALTAKNYTPKTAVYVVKPGDTLWEIAERHKHLDQKAECFEEFFTWVCKANKGTYLQPGQEVNIPYFEKK